MAERPLAFFRVTRPPVWLKSTGLEAGECNHTIGNDALSDSQSDDEGDDEELSCLAILQLDDNNTSFNKTSKQ